MSQNKNIESVSLIEVNFMELSVSSSNGYKKFQRDMRRKARNMMEHQRTSTPIPDNQYQEVNSEPQKEIFFQLPVTMCRLDSGLCKCKHCLYRPGYHACSAPVQNLNFIPCHYQPIMYISQPQSFLIPQYNTRYYPPLVYYPVGYRPDGTYGALSGVWYI